MTCKYCVGRTLHVTMNLAHSMHDTWRRVVSLCPPFLQISLPPSLHFFLLFSSSHRFKEGTLLSLRSHYFEAVSHSLPSTPPHPPSPPRASSAAPIHPLRRTSSEPLLSPITTKVSLSSLPMTPPPSPPKDPSAAPIRHLRPRSSDQVVFS